VVITGIDNQEALEQAFTAVKTFQLMNGEQVAALVAKTQEAAGTVDAALNSGTSSTRKIAEEFGTRTSGTN
jgi:hypothetical protein